MTKTFFIPNKQSILGEQEILTAKSILALVDGLESHSYDAVYLRQPLSRLEYIECAIVGQSQFLFKVSYADDQKAYRVDLPDLLTKTDWEIIKSFLDALLAYTGTEIEGLDGFDFEAYFQASIQAYLADTAARFTICQGIFNPVFFSHEDLKSFLEADGLKHVYVQFKRQMLTLQEFPSIRMEKDKFTVFTIWLKESRLFYRENHLFLLPILSNCWIRKFSGRLTWFKLQETALNQKTMKPLPAWTMQNS